MFWLAPDTVPTMGDWFRAGGYRTFYKGKWHVSHAYLDAPDGKGYLQSIDDDSAAIPENIAAYLKADLLDDYGFSEWVGPEPHGLGKTNTGTAKDPYTADETIALLNRLDADESDQPWLAVCSFLNPHDIAIFGVVALAQGLRYDNDSVPHILMRRRTTRICPPSPRVRRATTRYGERCSRRSRGWRHSAASTISYRRPSMSR